MVHFTRNGYQRRGQLISNEFLLKMRKCRGLMVRNCHLCRCATSLVEQSEANIGFVTFMLLLSAWTRDLGFINAG